MTTMHPFPKIGQFRNVLKYLKNSGHDTVMYRGTVKLHGTHCDFVQGADGVIQYQSRNRVITEVGDLSGLIGFLDGVDITPLFEVIRSETGHTGEISISGEYCGGSIQPGVALSGQEKFVMLYAACLISPPVVEGEGGGGVDGDYSMYEADCDKNRVWLDFYEYSGLSIPEARIFNIMQFPTWVVEVDPFNPDPVRTRMEELTLEVERECPVALGVYGVSGTGEGIVWNCITPGLQKSALFFKTKGVAHRVVNTPHLIEIDPEVITGAEEFTVRTLTENRLEQGVAYLAEQGLPQDRTSTGKFVAWVWEDIIKEEGDLLSADILTHTKKIVKSRAANWLGNR